MLTATELNEFYILVFEHDTDPVTQKNLLFTVQDFLRTFYLDFFSPLS
jgi:hypothetical protein